MTKEELKKKFIDAGYHVWEEQDLVILKLEKGDTGAVLYFDFLDKILLKWEDILKNRNNNPVWDEVLTKLGIN